jgi:hypothetical protein
MDCRELTGASDGEEVRKHLRSCQVCRELNATLNPPAVSEMQTEMLDWIEKKLLADLRPVRPLWPRGYFFAGFGAAFAAIVCAGVYVLGANGIRAMSSVQLVTVLLVVGANVALLSESLVRQMVPGSRHWMQPALVPAAVIAALLAVMALGFEFRYEPEFWVLGWICLRAGISVAVLAALPFWLLLRRGILLRPGTAGASVGLLAGLAGTSLLELHCPILDAAHILAWHAGPSVLGALIGAAIGLAAERITRVT